VKFEAYKGIPSLEEYVLVSTDEKRVEVRRRSAGGWSVETALEGEMISLRGLPVAVGDFYV
jgi:Uma2 family endonuclease